MDHFCTRKNKNNDHDSRRIFKDYKNETKEEIIEI